MKYHLLLKGGRVVDAAAGLDGPMDVGRLYRRMMFCADGKGGVHGEEEE